MKPTVDHFSDQSIKVFALGGLGEVGKNMYVVEKGDEIIIIDSGILFPENSYGIDYIIPDYTYLKANEDKIVGLFITHGHEDHIGGIPYLLRMVKVPAVYASGLAVSLIKNKMSEFARTNLKLIEYNDESIYSFKNFTLSFFRTNHSIPDSHGIAIKTSEGYILHTGDFKFDFTPIGHHADYHKLTTYGHEGIAILLADSTNSGVTRFTSSERKISSSIRNLFTQIKGRILISTFASNVYRVQQIVEASVATGRKVIVFGRSMEKTINVGQQLNYINAPSGTFINAKEFPHFPPEKITILSTGSQGEPLAALSRIAEGTHKTIKIIPGDTIVFSSSPIPGNKESINRTINKLYKAGAQVIINSPVTDTHTSGHASQEELKLMLVLTKPKYFMPIHGEYAMQHKHAELAIQTGIPEENCFILSNGEVLTLENGQARSEHCVHSGDIYIDSNNALADGTIIKERKLLADDGMFSVTFAMRGNTQIAQPVIVSRGFIYMKQSEELVNVLALRSYETMEKYLKSHKIPNVTQAKGFIVSELTNYIYELTERRPIIIPIIMEANA
ncbi:MAG: ribonuclease J [Bacilli bacterium]|nr:ribonuclease J [Bacilli bacterium]